MTTRMDSVIGAGSPAGTPASSPDRPGPRRPLRAVAWVVLAIAAIGGGSYVARYHPEEAIDAWRSVVGKKHAKAGPAEAPDRSGPRPPWDGFVKLSDGAISAMGVKSVEVIPQIEPIRLGLLGTTEYISDTLIKVRPMFKGRVDKVHVTVGQSVKKGDPLVDLYSTELARAKGAYEIERIQWLYDKNLLDIRESLLRSKTISQQLYDETKNNEMKNRREYEVARDNLIVFGLGEAEVENVKDQPGSEKARLTLRSASDGLVTVRDVVPGNLYDENDTLLVIAPLDRLWVWGNVFESDLDLVKLGQGWEIRFPFLNQKLRGTVEYISNRVDPGTHAVRIRTSIPNAEGKLKSDMLVRGMLEIPPVAGRVVVPRTALVIADGHPLVFVETGAAGKFERRSVVIAQEKDDHAVIDGGLKAGEKVVAIGALILAQLYEDAQTAETGAPAAKGSNADGSPGT